MVSGDTYQSRNGYSDKVVAIDVGNSCYLHASHASPHHIWQTCHLYTVHIPAGYTAKNIHAEAIQTVHGGEHTQIEAGASYGISPLCGDVFP